MNAQPIKIDDVIVDKMIEKCNGLRSCIVTFRAGPVATFSFPKELEPTDKNEKKEWRLLLRMRIALLIGETWHIDIKHIKYVLFDDEV